MTLSMLHCSNTEDATEQRLNSVGPKTIPKFPGVILFNLLLAVNFDKNLNMYCILRTTFEGNSSFKMYLCKDIKELGLFFDYLKCTFCT